MKKSYTDNLRFRSTFSPFSLGDLVLYRGSKHTHRAKIIEVVKYGMYPHTRVRIRGFYREYISYVILLDNGTYLWPRNTSLSFLKCKSKITSSEQILFNSFEK